MNSQTVLVSSALKSKTTLLLIAGSIPVSLYLSSGFISVSIIWFFALSLFHYATEPKQKLVKHVMLLLPVLLFFLHITGLFLAADLQAGINLALREIHLLLIPLGFMLVGSKITEKELRAILGVFLFTFFAASIIGLSYAAYHGLQVSSLALNIGDQNPDHLIKYLIPEPINLTPVYMSLYASFALLIVMLFPVIKMPMLKTAAALYLALLIVLLSFPAGVLCVICIGLMFAFSVLPRKQFFIAVLAFVSILVVIGTSFPCVTKELSASLIRLEYKRPDLSKLENTERLTVLLMTWETLKQSPLLIGYGTGQGQNALERTYQQEGFTVGVRDKLNSHNQFLSTTLDFGIIGLIAITSFLIVPFFIAIRSRDLFGIGFITIILVFFFVESVLLRQRGVVFVSFFYSIMFFRFRSEKSKIETT